MRTRENGATVDHPVIRKAFETRKMAQAGVTITLDDIPSYVVLQLMTMIENQTQSNMGNSSTSNLQL